MNATGPGDLGKDGYRGNILVVDDTPQNLRLLSTLLSRRGYKVRSAISGQMALTAVKAAPADLILLDISMPQMDGYQVCQALKADPKTAEIPVIFISALDDVLDKVKAFATGGADYITKPFQVEEVLARVEHQLTLRSLQKQLQAHNERLREEIREREEAEIAMKQAKEAAEIANRAKSQFLAMMSHEIRTPLNGVLGMAQLLAQTDLTLQQQQLLKNIEISGETLLTVINDILDFSKIESGQMELEDCPFDLQACIEDAYGLLAPQALKKDLELLYWAEPYVPARICGDTQRLRQILINLINNAVKFTPTGEIEIYVQRVDQTGASGQQVESLEMGDDPLDSDPDSLKAPVTLLFSVRDTGIGIPPEKKDRLFKPFSQLDTTASRDGGGTGLGLAICARLTEMMGGRIWVESTPGQGSTFSFTIQACVDPEQPSASLSTPVLALKGKRILLLSDYPVLLSLLERQCFAWGMQPLIATSIASALTQLRESTPMDLVMIDWGDASSTRSQVIEPIRAVLPQVPLLLLTPLDQHQLSSIPTYLPHTTTVPKPIKPSQLLDTLIHLSAGEDAEADPSTPTTPPDHDSPLAKHLPLTILLAEDNVINQQLALAVLETMGYQADVVTTGAEAVVAFQNHSYDLILMDVQMPELDGLEATRMIRQYEREQSVPPNFHIQIVAMTANAMSGDRELCLAAGMDDYVSKPILIEEVRRVLERCGQLVALRRSLINARSESASASDPLGQTSSNLPSLSPAEAPPVTVDPGTDVTSFPANGSKIDSEVQPIIDRGPINRLREVNPALVQQVLSSFLQGEALRLFNLIRESANNEDFKLLERSAHTLKSTSAMFGAYQLSQICQEIEVSAKQHAVDSIPVLLQQLEDHYAEVHRELSKLLEAELAQGSIES